MPKVSEVEFPLISLGVTFTQELRQKGKRAADWEEPVEWCYLAAFHSPLVEQLREKFSGLEVRGMKPVRKKGQPSGTVSGQSSATIPAPLPTPRQKTGPTATGEAASPLRTTTPNLARLHGRQPLESSRWQPSHVQPLASHRHNQRLPLPSHGFPLRSGVAAGILGWPRGSGASTNQGHIGWEPREIGGLLEPGVGTSGSVQTGIC